jgi:hypothetical protein
VGSSNTVSQALTVSMHETQSQIDDIHVLNSVAILTEQVATSLKPSRRETILPLAKQIVPNLVAKVDELFNSVRLEVAQ